MQFADAQLSLDDWGVVQGVVIVDRLRTCQRQVLDLGLHMQRLKANCLAIGVSADELAALPQVIGECARRNQEHFDGEDLGIVVLVTPGVISAAGHATVIVHVQRLNWSLMTHWYEHGQTLVLAKNRNVPAECWSPQLKTRARLHYYLADRESLAAAGPQAGAVLLNTAGFVTETSAASLVIVDEFGRVCCPPEQDVLGGIALMRTLRLAAAAGFPVVRQPISLAHIESAREVLLAGTSGCLWPAARFAECEFPNSVTSSVYVDLRDRWMAEIGLDYIAQSKSFVQRNSQSAVAPPELP